jgi:hypothetical protein
MWIAITGSVLVLVLAALGLAIRFGGLTKAVDGGFKSVYRQLDDIKGEQSRQRDDINAHEGKIGRLEGKVGISGGGK